LDVHGGARVLALEDLQPPHSRELRGPSEAADPPQLASAQIMGLAKGMRVGAHQSVPSPSGPRAGPERAPSGVAHPGSFQTVPHGRATASLTRRTSDLST